MKWRLLTPLLLCVCNTPQPPPDTIPPPVPGVPPPPKATTPASTDTITFALYDVFLGDSTRSGVASPDAWKDYGYDLDNKPTTNKSTDVCTPMSGAGTYYQVDGNDGIDNSWGHNIMALLLNLQADLSLSTSAAIHNGQMTLQIQVRGLTGDPKQSSTGLSGSIFPSGAYEGDGGKPSWSLQTGWPVFADALVDGKTIPSGAQQTFDGYINAGTLVTATSMRVTLRMMFRDLGLDLHIERAIVTFPNAPPLAQLGIIAGVIKAADFIEQFKKLAAAISLSLCTGSALDGIVTNIRKAQDILSDGTNVPGRPCDAISVGIGFTGKQIANPTSVVEDPVLPNLCDGGTPDAGADQ